MLIYLQIPDWRPWANFLVYLAHVQQCREQSERA